MGEREAEIRERLAPLLEPIPPNAGAAWLERRSEARHAVAVCGVGDLRYLLDRVAELEQQLADARDALANQDLLGSMP